MVLGGNYSVLLCFYLGKNSFPCWQAIGCLLCLLECYAYVSLPCLQNAMQVYGCLPCYCNLKHFRFLIVPFYHLYLHVFLHLGFPCQSMSLSAVITSFKIDIVRTTVLKIFVTYLSEHGCNVWSTTALLKNF